LKRLILLTFFLLAACVPTQSTPQNVDPSPAPIFTAIPTLTPVPPQVNAAVDNTVFDFADQMCSARWMNSGRDIACPTDLAWDQTDNGYVDLTDPRGLNLKESARVLVTYPAQNGFTGIFGRYPAYRVNAGDQFYAHLGCMTGFSCDVEFSLEYYDLDGKYHDGFARWNYHASEPLLEAIADLTPLAGQRVEFVLVVRPQSQREDAWAIWIDPKIISTQP